MRSTRSIEILCLALAALVLVWSPALMQQLWPVIGLLAAASIGAIWSSCSPDFGARSVILLKDVDGLYTADPKTDPAAEFIAEIGAAALAAMRLPTLPIEPIVLELLARTKLVRGIRLVNGLVPGNLTRALAGEPVGTWIHA